MRPWYAIALCSLLSGVFLFAAAPPPAPRWQEKELKKLRFGNPWRRYQTILSLGRTTLPCQEAIPNPATRKAIAKLIEQLGDDDCFVRNDAQDKLGQLGHLAVADLHKATRSRDPEVVNRAWHLLYAYYSGKAPIKVTGKLAALEELLNDREPAVRRAAILALGRMGPAATPLVPKLLQVALKDVNANVSREDCSDLARQAGRSLARIGPAGQAALTYALDAPDWSELACRAVRLNGKTDTKGLAQLRKLLQSPSANIRVAAARALAALGPAAKAALPELRDGLKDRDEATRVACAAALYYVGAPIKETLPVLVKAMDSYTSSIKTQAKSALKDIGPDAVAALEEEALLSTSKRRREEVIYLLGEMTPVPDSSLVVFRKYLNDPDTYLRRAALWSVGRCGVRAKIAVSDLIGALSSTDEYTRRYALESLGLIGDAGPDTLKAIKGKLDDTLTSVRLEAVKALGKLGTKAADAETDVEALLKDTDPAIRVEAAQTLLNIGGSTKHAQTVLEDLLKSANHLVGVRAARVHYRITGETTRALPVLRDALADTDASVRQTAIIYLVTLRGKASDTLPHVQRAMMSCDNTMREFAVDVLGRCRPVTALSVNLLEEALDDHNELVRYWAVRGLGFMGPKAKLAIPQLTRTLHDGSAKVRLEAAYSLWLITGKTESLLTAGVAVLKDVRPGIRRTALEYLGQMPDKELPLAALRQVKEQDDDLAAQVLSAKLLAGIDPASNVLPVLRRGLQHGGSSTRQVACDGLAKLGKDAARAIPDLVTALDDSVARVRRDAILALGVLKDSSAKAKVQAALKDESAEVRLAAERTLSMLAGKDDTRAILTRALTRGSRDEQRAAAWHLWDFAHRTPWANQTLLALCKSKDYRQREIADDYRKGWPRK